MPIETYHYIYKAVNVIAPYLRNNYLQRGQIPFLDIDKINRIFLLSGFDYRQFCESMPETLDKVFPRKAFVIAADFDKKQRLLITSISIGNLD